MGIVIEFRWFSRHKPARSLFLARTFEKIPVIGIGDRFRQTASTTNSHSGLERSGNAARRETVSRISRLTVSHRLNAPDARTGRRRFRRARRFIALRALVIFPANSEANSISRFPRASCCWSNCSNESSSCSCTSLRLRPRPVSGIPPRSSQAKAIGNERERGVAFFLCLRFSEAPDELLTNERRAPVCFLRERPSASRHG
jgi:hypothetical protein